MTAFFRTGSFGNGTNIRGYSDVDSFAVIPRENLKQDSDITLRKVAIDLRERFPFTEGIRVASPGVRVPFGLDGEEAVEIVPVDQTGHTQLGFRQFDMPDGNGGWKFSAPESHNAYVNRIDELHGGEVKPLIRFIKAWKFKRNAPIRSFYLEIRTAQYAAAERSIIYDMDVNRVLAMLWADKLAAVPDPRFPRGAFVLSACRTELQRQDALSKLRNATIWASEAVNFRFNGQERAAFQRWDLVYDHDFPAYGAF